jgi:hypothetical protein
VILHRTTCNNLQCKRGYAILIFDWFCNNLHCKLLLKVILDYWQSVVFSHTVRSCTTYLHSIFILPQWYIRNPFHFLHAQATEKCYSFKATDKAMDEIKKCLAYLNDHLLTKTYLVVEQITLADITVACNLLMLYKQVWLNGYTSFSSVFFSLLIVLF